MIIYRDSFTIVYVIVYDSIYTIDIYRFTIVYCYCFISLRLNGAALRVDTTELQWASWFQRRTPPRSVSVPRTGASRALGSCLPACNASSITCLGRISTWKGLGGFHKSIVIRWDMNGMYQLVDGFLQYNMEVSINGGTPSHHPVDY